MSDIIFFIFLLLLLLTSGLCAGITSGMFSLNHYQLKRKAQLGDKDAKVVYPIHSLHFQLLVTLLVINITANATIAIMLSTKTNGLFAVIFSSIFILLFGEIIPMIYFRKHVVRVTAILAPIITKLVAVMTPVSKPIARILDRWIGDDTQIFYTKEELLRIFNSQKFSKESDIPVNEVRLLRTVLHFNDKKIRDAMTPRRMVKLVKFEDVATPLFVDELHQTGHSRFPVVTDAKQLQFVGTLYLRDLINVKNSKKIADVMHADVRYIHEEESLDHALRAFLRLKHHLFIVVNNFEEFVGVISIEDVLEEIIGHEIIDEFDQHDDLRAVAKSLAEKDRQERLKEEKTEKQDKK